MFCTHCGAQVADGTKFCQNCGASLSAPTTQPAPETATPVTAQPIMETPIAPKPQLPAREETPVTKFISALSEGVRKAFGKVNIFAFGALISSIIYTILLFVPTEAELYLEGFFDESEELPLLVAMFEFEMILPALLFFVLLAIFPVTVITNFIHKSRASLVGPVFACITGFMMILTAIGISGDKEYTQYSRYLGSITYDVEYATGGYCAALVIGAIILISTSILGHMIEKERLYQKAISEANNA